MQGLTKIGPNLSDSSKPRQTAREAYKFHRDLIDNNFFLPLTYDADDRISNLPTLLEFIRQNSQYHPAVVFRVVLNVIKNIQDIRKILIHFPGQKFDLLEALLEDELSFNRLIYSLSSLLIFFDHISDHERLTNRIMLHLLTHEQAFIHIHKTADSLGDTLHTFTKYSDAIYHYILNHKKIFNHIFKTSHDIIVVIRKFSHLHHDWIIQHRSPGVETDYFFHHFVDVLSHHIADKDFFHRVFKTEEDLANLIKILDQWHLFSEIVATMVAYILKDSAMFYHFFKTNEHLSNFLQKFKEQRLTSDCSWVINIPEPVQNILEHILSNPQLFQHLFPTELSIECLSSPAIFKPYAVKALAVFKQLKDAESQAASVFSHPQLFFPTIDRSQRLGIKREHKEAISSLLYQAPPLDIASLDEEDTLESREDQPQPSLESSR